MQADGGTVFPDEIGEMDPHGQAKILRAIENKEVQRLGDKRSRVVDVRIVAATNQKLEELILVNKFRRDLYFRLGVTQIHLPPLRERPEDIPTLADFFVRELNQRRGRKVLGLSPDLLECLTLHSWPGNVRELRNLMEALFVNNHDGWITPADLPHHYLEASNGAQSRPEEERVTLLRALQAQTSWNKTNSFLAQAALHWSRMTLYRKDGAAPHRKRLVAPQPYRTAPPCPPGHCLIFFPTFFY